MVYRLALFAIWLARWFPPRVRYAFGACFGELAYWGWGTKRRITQENIAIVLDRPPHHPQVRQMARASWRNYGRYIADFFAFPSCSLEMFASRFVDISPGLRGYRGIFAQAHEGQRGVVIATAHFGNWDVGGVIFASADAVSVIVETFRDPRLDALIQGQRIARGMNVIPMEGTARRFLRVLLRQEAIGILVDRPLTAKDGVPVTFFGHRAYVPAGPAQLALKTGAALTAGFCWYAPNSHFYGLITEPIVYEPTGDQEHDVQALTQCLYTLLEGVIRAHPEQWYMFRPFWADSNGASAVGYQSALATTPQSEENQAGS
jgi:lauroyl/myristoyl acyltransferase